MAEKAKYESPSFERVGSLSELTQTKNQSSLADGGTYKTTTAGVNHTFLTTHSK